MSNYLDGPNFVFRSFFVNSRNLAESHAREHHVPHCLLAVKIVISLFWIFLHNPTVRSWLLKTKDSHIHLWTIIPKPSEKKCLPQQARRQHQNCGHLQENKGNYRCNKEHKDPNQGQPQKTVTILNHIKPTSCYYDSPWLGSARASGGVRICFHKWGISDKLFLGGRCDFSSSGFPQKNPNLATLGHDKTIKNLSNILSELWKPLTSSKFPSNARFHLSWFF